MILTQAYRKLADVREEYYAAKFSLAETLRAYNTDPNLHRASRHEQITLGHLQACSENLEVTYLVRLFAEFEGVLRDYWLHARKRSTIPPMIDLMDSLAAYRTMQADDLNDAHEVRRYRNDVVHDHLQNPRFNFPECCSRLARFVKWLPLKW